eukprot:scaffold23868_cov59-Phaeocystis_antarctica.AAC.1
MLQKRNQIVERVFYADARGFLSSAHARASHAAPNPNRKTTLEKRVLFNSADESGKTPSQLLCYTDTQLG